MQVSLFNLFDRVKSFFSEIAKSRLMVSVIAFCLMAAILVSRVFYLQIVKGDYYLNNYKLKIQKTKETQGTRGNIYDRNGNLLAYNRLAYSVTIEDSGSYSSTQEKNESLNKTIQEIIEVVERNGDSVVEDFGITLGNDGNYEFVNEGTRRLRFIADVYGKKKVDELSEKQKNYTAEEIVNDLCGQKRSDKLAGFGIDQENLDKGMVLKILTVRYQMYLNNYQKYITTTIASDVSEETVAVIMESLDTYQGVNIEEESLRCYVDSEYFSSIIGYTGKISQDEYDAYTEEGKDYSLTDVVGKAGLEQSMDEILQGKHGTEKIYVDNMGKVIETVSVKEATAGNDLYLSIDKDLQEATYKILEEEIAGIVYSKMENVMNYDRSQVGDESDIIIPIDDVYNAFFANNILDIDHFTAEDAKTTEQNVASKFEQRRESVIARILEELRSPSASAYKDLSKEMQAYMNYIASDLLTSKENIIQKDKIDTNDSTYIAWKTDETISLYEYLNYAISKNWIDTSKLQDYISSDGKYSDSQEVYEGILQYLSEYLQTDKSFHKLIYRYMIKDGTIAGREVCMMLYEQGILAEDDAKYNALASGSITAYDFLREKIKNLEITPGQLGLEPCSGAAIVTDVDTGQVLACVSYPGYDSNLLANNMDSAYYNKLVNDLSSPFYNKVTQEKTAPGSTYKMVTATAGLTEGVISGSSLISCDGPFKKITPEAKCWIYPHGHGNLSVVGGIQNSCNNFFYEVGYRLSLSGGIDEAVQKIDKDGEMTKDRFSNTKGLETLEKYASMFGLNEKSGLEIPEADPQISDEDSVRSAIGQGTNNFTVSQLNRYVTAVANKGTVYDLTLLDHVEDWEGNVIEEYEPTVHNEITEVSSETWNLIHKGMKAVIENKASFADLRSKNFSMSGKTGTAQQSKTHANHGLFVGFAPSESPEVSVTVRIANGYSSSYAAEVAKNIMKYHFNLYDESEIIRGQAATIAGNGENDGD